MVEGVAEHAKKIKVGHGFDPETSMGPLVSEEQINRVCNYLESGLSEGAEAVTGGHKRAGAGYFVEPTVMVNTKPDMKVVREEIFGPVVCAMPFSDLDKLAAEANQSEYGLAARHLDPRHQQGALAGRTSCAPARCGSTATTSSTRPCPSAATSSQAGAARWGTKSLELYTEVKAVCIAL